MDSGLKSQGSHNQTLSMEYVAIVRIRAILSIFIPLAYDLLPIELKWLKPFRKHRIVGLTSGIIQAIFLQN